MYNIYGGIGTLRQLPLPVLSNIVMHYIPFGPSSDCSSSCWPRCEDGNTGCRSARMADKQSVVTSIPEIYSTILMPLTCLLTFMQSLVFGAYLFLVFTAYWPSFQTAVSYRGRLRVRRVHRRLQSKSRAFERSLGCALCAFLLLILRHRLLHPPRRFRDFS